MNWNAYTKFADRLEFELRAATEASEQAVKAFNENPVYALEWGDTRVFQPVARKHFFDTLWALFEDVEADGFDEWLVDTRKHFTDELLRQTRAGETSSHASQNLLDRTRMKVIALELDRSGILREPTNS